MILKLFFLTIYNLTIILPIRCSLDLKILLELTQLIFSIINRQQPLTILRHNQVKFDRLRYKIFKLIFVILKIILLKTIIIFHYLLCNKLLRIISMRNIFTHILATFDIPLFIDPFYVVLRSLESFAVIIIDLMT